MADEAILDSLREVEFFHDFADEDLKQLAAFSRIAEYPAHANIFEESDTAEEIFVIISGEVSLVICTPSTGCRQLMVAKNGDLIGWSPLVERRRLYDTAHTLARTKAIVINGQQILAFCQEHPKFGFEFMRRTCRVLADRLSATRLQLLDISGGRLPEVVLESD